MTEKSRPPPFKGIRGPLLRALGAVAIVVDSSQYPDCLMAGPAESTVLQAQTVFIFTPVFPGTLVWGLGLELVLMDSRVMSEEESGQ